MTRIGVLGGTFDPIHLGHLVAGSEALNAFSLDRVVFVPAGDPWQKDAVADAEDRFMMTLLGTAGHPGFSVSRIELDRRGPTYTADTVAALHDYYGDVEIFFILGADAAANLGTWKKLDELASRMEVIAVERPGTDLKFPVQDGWPKVHTLEIPALEVSGSELRARVREGRSIDFLVPHDVVTYIRTHGLYVGERRAEPA
jgi:nicotinate-nucleotide adenylyltransferase